MKRCNVKGVWYQSAVAVLGSALLVLGSLAPTPLPIQADGSPCVNPSGTAGCLSSIQAAVDAAKPGDVVTVAAGTYKGAVVIRKAITLQGAGAELTILDATGVDHALTVQGVSGPAAAMGLTAANADLAGILLRDSSQITLFNNAVRNNDKKSVPSAIPGGRGNCAGAPPFDGDDCGEGVHLEGVTSSIISNNLVEANIGGILVTDETGPTHDNWIVGNTVQNNERDCGITLASHPAGLDPPQGPPAPGYGVYNNTVLNNVSTGNGSAGVGVFGPTPGTASHDNVIIGNTLTNNGLPGVSIRSHTPEQNLNGNIIVNNTISGNGPDPDAPSGRSGIAIFSDAGGHAAPITGTVISGNTISDQETGVYFGTTASDASLTFNALGSTVVGVKNGGTGSVDAAWNYWGCPGGPGAAGCSATTGAVNGSSWLTSSPAGS
jgi:parallel beta-helix repeat protein